MHHRRVSLENKFPLSQNSITETKPSQFSSAVQSLISTAGGVYLSLVTIVSFLKINIPQVISINFGGYFPNRAETALNNVTFDPLALIAIALAVAEPVVFKMAEIAKNFFKGR